MTPAVVSQPTRLVESESTPNVLYRVTPSSCPCKDFQFHAHIAEYQCKHMRQAFPRLCGNCSTERVQVAGDWCRGCMNLKHSCEGQAAVAAAEAVVRGYEGAEKALRTPVATSITRVATNSPLEIAGW